MPHYDYKVRRAWIDNDANVTESKRATTIFCGEKLNIGGLYFLGYKRRLYRIVELLSVIECE